MIIGFIGLGHMGSAIAGNLLKGGHELVAWNRSPAAVERLVARGAHAAQTAAEAMRCEVVFSMLAEDRVVEDVIVGSGALAAAHSGAIHVNLATVSVAFAERMEALHEDHGMAYVAAPVLGRPDLAAAGGLAVLAAGPAEAVETVRPLLALIGARTWPIGERAHLANVVKIACNFSLASMIETLGEAGALAKAHGVEPAALYEVMTNTLFAAPAYKTYAALIADQRFEPAGFKLPLGLKDVRLALQAGDAKHVPLPVGSLLRDQLLAAISAGDAEKDWSALSQVAFRNAGL
jgi:3-hydroxyisobutyrate dehydrogenase-like beta-hydroxyacid dehydrogenase